MTVRIPPRPKVNVECMVIDDDEIVLTVEDAQWLLAAWMQVEHRSYYRVQVRSWERPSSRFVAFYEPAQQRGRYAALGDNHQSVVLTNLHAPAAPWDDAMLDLMLAAEQEDTARATTPSEQASV